jgi:hypothetical protein
MKLIFAVAIYVALVLFPAAALAQDITEPPLSVTGVGDPRVTAENYHQTACAKPHAWTPGGRPESWSRHWRPSVAITNREKRQFLASHPEYTDKNPSHYEWDHYWPIAAGGSPTSLNNLWAQPAFGEWNFHVKDNLEFWSYKHLCLVGDLSLDEVRSIFTHTADHGWIDECKKRFGPDPKQCGEKFNGHGAD